MPGHRRSKGAIWRMLMTVTLLAIADPRVSSQTMQTISHRIDEELQQGTVIADIKKDARLSDRFNQSTLNALRFQFLTVSENSEYFDLDQDSGLIRSSGRLDRDKICPGLSVCIIRLDVAIQPPHFHQIKLAFEIQDLNDNAPRFSKSVLKASVSESTAPGVFFSIQTAEDVDSPRNGVVRYILQHKPGDKFDLKVGKNPDGFINDVSLVLTDVLDREEKDSYQVKILAIDGGHPAKTGSVTVDIIVTDVNDHRPEFERSKYEVEVVENAPPKRALLTVQATDADTGLNGQVKYKFSPKTQQQFGGHFHMDSESGTLSQLQKLDYEQLQHNPIMLEVLAQDYGDGSSPVMTRIAVNVRDVNDNSPEIKFDLSESDEEQNAISLTENCPNNTFVVQLSVQDPDSEAGGEVHCNLQQPNGSRVGQFRLVKTQYDNEYQIVTSGDIDRETTDRYRLTVYCKDGGRPPLNSSSDVVIIVVDVNDNSPRFTQHIYNISIQENNRPFKHVNYRIMALDADEGLNGDVTYSIQSETQSVFEIDKTSGAIWTVVPLDRETNSFYQFYVMARDGGDQGAASDQSKFSSVLVTVNVIDVNDEPPRFEQPSYNFTIAENTHGRTRLGQVIAFDPDLLPFNRPTFHLDGSTTNNPANRLFVIDQNDGTLYAKKSLNREEKDTYRFNVIVKDDNLQHLQDTTLITVTVTDENDNPPYIEFPTVGNETVYVAKTVSAGHRVTKILASDPDLGENAQLTYLISQGNEHGVFSLDSVTGELFVNVPFSSKHEHFRLVVLVKDNGTTAKISMATLQVIVSNTAASSQIRPLAAKVLTDTHITIVIGIVAGCLLIVMALVCVICVVSRRKRKPPPQGRPENGTEKSVPVVVDIGKDVKYNSSINCNGSEDRCSQGVGSDRSNVRGSLMVEELENLDGFVVVNCSLQNEAIPSPLTFDRRSRLYSMNSDGGKCCQCETGLAHEPAFTGQPVNSQPSLPAFNPARYVDCSRYTGGQYPTARPFYTIADYGDAATLPSHSSPDWLLQAVNQRKQSFSKWLNSENFQLQQKGQVYNVNDYSSIPRIGAMAAQRFNEDHLYRSQMASPVGTNVGEIRPLMNDMLKGFSPIAVRASPTYMGMYPRSQASAMMTDPAPDGIGNKSPPDISIHTNPVADAQT